MSDFEAEELSYEEVWQRIAELAEALAGHSDPVVAGQVTELLDWVDAFHRDGLGRLVDMARSWRGEIFLEAVAEDPVAGTLLAAYGLGESREVDSEARSAVLEALDELRPYAESHGGSIELEEVVDGVVKVRMLGACDGCPSSAATLKHGVEEALRRHWEDFRRLELVEDKPPAAAVPTPDAPLLQIRGHPVS